ncbi:MAG: methyltransferase type 11, partial [Sphingobacterium sp.]
VEIFKTNVQNDKDADKIITFLLALYPVYKINFDLEDEENILRVEANKLYIEANKIINYMIRLGYNCERIE